MTAPDDLHARAPVDRVAARVVLGKGQHFEPQKKIQEIESDLPLPVRPAPTNNLADPNFVDLTGITFGRFRVLGLSLTKPKRWVVRCVCGRYSLRTAKAIRNPLNGADRCAHCHYLEYLQRDKRLEKK